MICVRGVFHKFNLFGIKYRPAVFRGKNEIWQISHWLKETGCLCIRKVNSGPPALLDEIDRHIL